MPGCVEQPYSNASGSALFLSVSALAVTPMTATTVAVVMVVALMLPLAVALMLPLAVALIPEAKPNDGTARASLRETPSLSLRLRLGGATPQPRE